MPAYLLFIREGKVVDPSRMDTYHRKTREAPRDPNLKPLAVYGTVEALEGEAPDGVVLLEFPTADDAKRWYNSPEYQEALVHRKMAANYRALLIEGLS